MTTYQNQLIAQYKFEDTVQIGKDSSGKGHDGIAKGEIRPVISELKGRTAVTFNGGANGTSYLQLPSNLLQDVSDNTGVTIATWVFLGKGSNVWERILTLAKARRGRICF